jgi:hypothetical protein
MLLELEATRLERKSEMAAAKLARKCLGAIKELYGQARYTPESRAARITWIGLRCGSNKVADSAITRVRKLDIPEKQQTAAIELLSRCRELLAKGQRCPTVPNEELVQRPVAPPPPPLVPAPNRGAFDVVTGRYFPPAGSGVIGTRTGE